MENIITVLVGILLIVFAYLIGVRKKIQLVHSYHYKNVSEDDKPSFCKGVGLGNLIIGIGLVLFPLFVMFFGENAAMCIEVVFMAAGAIAALSTIKKYNGGLF
ncbi:MAG: DUF3784 domain-containing protein [Oscillospiraceae bacterium]|nr:DUF3784 domain-containing protein [Oscillospiraceae bacterium]